MATITGRTDGRTDRVRRNMRPPPREEPGGPHKKHSQQTMNQDNKTVSLTSCVSKLMEKLLKDKIFEYVVESGLINDSQHGFISKKSYLTNL